MNAGLETKEIERYFDEHTKGVCRKYEDEFDHSKEEYEIQKAKRISMIIFECVKGTVRDNWSMLKESEYRPIYENESRELTLSRRSNHEAMVGLFKKSRIFAFQIFLMRIDIITLFPKLLQSPFEASIVKRAIEGEKVEVVFHDPRDYTVSKYKQVDDAPFGGGAGM